MTAKETILDFINLLLILLLVGFCIIFFIQGRNFENFILIMKALVPFSFFGIILLFRWRSNRHEARNRKENDSFDMVIRMTYMEKLIIDMIVYSIPIAVLAVPFIKTFTIETLDILEASIAFLLAYWAIHKIFSKESL